MTEQEIKAWSLSIAVQIKGQGLSLAAYTELANQIADYLGDESESPDESPLILGVCPPLEMVDDDL